MKRLQAILLAVMFSTFSAALVCPAQGPAILTPDRAAPALAQAKPGDVVLLAAGTYRDPTLRLNTIINPPVIGIAIGGGKGHDWGVKGIRNVPPSGNRIVNNLIVGDKADLLLQDEAPDNVVDHNLVFASGGAKVSSYGANAIKAAPRFVNAAAGDYRLAPGSPALKAGLPLPGCSNSVNIGATAEPVIFGPEDATEEKPLMPKR